MQQPYVILDLSDLRRTVSSDFRDEFLHQFVCLHFFSLLDLRSAFAACASSIKHADVFRNGDLEILEVVFITGTVSFSAEDEKSICF